MEKEYEQAKEVLIVLVNLRSQSVENNFSLYPEARELAEPVSPLGRYCEYRDKHGGQGMPEQKKRKSLKQLR